MSTIERALARERRLAMLDEENRSRHRETAARLERLLFPLVIVGCGKKRKRRELRRVERGASCVILPADAYLFRSGYRFEWMTPPAAPTGIGELIARFQRDRMLSALTRAFLGI